jgi:hypothetical protein
MNKLIEGMPIKRVPGDTEVYAIVLPKEIKRKLEELKLFHGVDVPKWIRGLIVDAVNNTDLPSISVEL